MKDVFVVLPGFNEEKHVLKTIKDIEKEGFSKVVFVDDGSADSTFKKALESNAVVLRHEINLGKGSAVKTGCDYALKRGAKIIVLMDSDGQHEAKDIKKFVKALRGKDIVFGYRHFDKKMPFTMRFGNAFLTLFSRFLVGINVKDTQAGFRCFTSEAYKKIRWHSRDYGMESEMIVRASKQKLKFSQIRISTIYHDAHKGTTPIDGFKVLFNMLKFKFFD